MAYIKLSNISYQLPSGEQLLSNINKTFSSKTGLIGNNGAGKSTLAAIIAGELTPTAGSIEKPAIISYIRQAATSGLVSDYLNISHKLKALAAIEAGSAEPAHYETVGNDWDIVARADELLRNFQLDWLNMFDSADNLSGGEKAALSICGAFLQKPDFIIFDEPTNHLDRNAKKALLELLRGWRNGAIIISHDRALLDEMDEIAELTRKGVAGATLKSYGGNYSYYREQKRLEMEALESDYRNSKSEYKNMKIEHQEKLERQDRRLSRGAKLAKSGGTPRIVLGGMKNSAENSSQKSSIEWNEKLSSAKAEMNEIYHKLSKYKIFFDVPDTNLPTNKVVLKADKLVLPYVNNAPISYEMHGAERLHIVGGNGSGKSTLINVLIGKLQPISGDFFIGVPFVLLGQESQPSEKSAVELIMEESLHSQGYLRERLAQVNLHNDRALLPYNALSGGEQLKVRLLQAIYKDPVPKLLILDEPTNHMDIESIEAVENVLNSYNGAIIVVSHDERFIKNLAITAELAVGG